MLVILSGKSASGKDALMSDLIKNNGFLPLTSFTSRPIRDGEQNGREYNFVSKQDFIKMIEEDKLLEYRTYNTTVAGVPDTWYYGCPKYELDQDKTYITILDLDGTKEFLDYYTGKTDILSVNVQVEETIREERAKGRGSFDKTEWDRRAADDKIKFSPENVSKVCSHILTNNADFASLKAGFIKLYNQQKAKQTLENMIPEAQEEIERD